MVFPIAYNMAWTWWDDGDGGKTTRFPIGSGMTREGMISEGGKTTRFPIGSGMTREGMTSGGR